MPRLMDPDTLSYTIKKGLISLSQRLDDLGRSDLTPDQRLTVSLAYTEVQQLFSSVERATPAPTDAVTPPSFPTPPAVLVVDDNPTNTALLVAMLATMGVEAASASHGAEALALFEDTPFDLVFMDVMLPDTTGVEVTRQIRESYGDRPYIVGQSALPSAASRCLDEGMDVFVAKPIHLADVSDAIERCLAAKR